MSSPTRPGRRFHRPSDPVLEEIDDETPTFVWAHYMDVQHASSHPRNSSRRFGKFRDPAATTTSRCIPKSTNADGTRRHDLYDAEIRFNDAEVGRLMDAVKSTWGDDYVMALTADHGDHVLDTASAAPASLSVEKARSRSVRLRLIREATTS